jgi:hypothetical protein
MDMPNLHELGIKEYEVLRDEQDFHAKASQLLEQWIEANKGKH